MAKTFEFINILSTMTKSIKFMSLCNMARKFGLESSNVENLVIFHLKTIQSSINGN